jgi:hypothetical protein
VKDLFMKMWVKSALPDLFVLSVRECLNWEYKSAAATLHESCCCLNFNKSLAATGALVLAHREENAQQGPSDDAGVAVDADYSPDEVRRLGSLARQHYKDDNVAEVEAH